LSAAERPGLVLAALYLAVSLWGLGTAHIVGDDEAREAGIVQAITAGDWLLPRFNGDLLPDKPLLFHWLAAIPCAAVGFSELAVRLPSALAGAALVAWTARFGADILGRPAGLVGALLLATTPALLSRARLARPDALLVLRLSMALGQAFRWWRDGQRSHATAALILVGAATLDKGPVAPVLFALTLLLFLAWQRDLRRLRGFLTPAGVTAFVVLGLGWYAIALAGWGGLFVREHLLGRYVGNLLGDLPAGGAYSGRPWSYHLLFYARLLPAIALPWTPVAALALWWAWRRDRVRDAHVRFLVCWALAPLIAFTPASYKLRYYLLPSLPAVALIAAPAVVALWRRGAERRDARVALLVAGTVALGAVAACWSLAAGLFTLASSDQSRLAAVLPLVPGGGAGATVMLAVATGLVAFATARGTWRPLIGAVIAASVAWLVFGTALVDEAVNRHDSLRAFARSVAARYPPPQPLAFYGDPIRSVVVYLGRPLPTLHRPEQVAPGSGVIARAPAYRHLSAEGAAGPPLVTGAGRVGNLERARVVLAEGRPRTPVPELR